MRALDSDDRAQCSNTFTSLTCYSKVPDTDAAVSSATTQQFSVLCIPSDAFHSTCVTLQGMGDGVGGRTDHTRRLITRACSQQGVIRVPFDVKDSIVVGLQSCTRWLCPSN